MINSEICTYFGYDYNIIENYLKNKKLVKELDFLEKEKNQRMIFEMTDKDKSLFDKGYSILLNKRKDLKIDYNSFARNKIKVDGQERKLFKFLNDSALSEEVGKYKLPNKKLYFVISTNPEDMMMCATGHSWTACTNLYKGDYKFTTLGNVFTNGRFIMYITDLEKVSFKSLESYNMFFRAFGFVGEDGQLYSNIWYPIREYVDMNYGNIYIKGVDKNIKSKYGIDIIKNNYDFFIFPYLDYCQNLDLKSGKFIIGKEYCHFFPMAICGNKEINVSKILWYGIGKTFEESLKRHCDCCGSKKGNIETIGDKNYCEECKSKLEAECSICGKKSKEFYFTENNEWICGDCLRKNNIKVCSICGTTIKMKKKTECKYCRSVKEDAFKNVMYEYYDKEKNNVRDYFRHHYVDAKHSMPPGIKEDEDFFSEYELFVKR